MLPCHIHAQVGSIAGDGAGLQADGQGASSRKQVQFTVFCCTLCILVFLTAYRAVVLHFMSSARYYTLLYSPHIKVAACASYSQFFLFFARKEKGEIEREMREGHEEMYTLNPWKKE